MSPGPRPSSMSSDILTHQAFGHNTYGSKMGRGVLRRCALIWEGRAVSPSNTMLRGSMPTFLPSGILTHPAIWPQQIWAENWEAVPLCASLWEEELGPHLTHCGKAEAYTFVASSIFIQPTVWPQYTNVTDRQHRQN